MQEAYNLHHIAQLPRDRLMSLNDVPLFEVALNAHIVVFKADAGNAIVYPSTIPDDGKVIYNVYMVPGPEKEDGHDCHFHAIPNITG